MDSLSKREKKILELLRGDTPPTIAEISKNFSVSRVTIRNDFNALVEKGILVKTRGGVIPAYHPKIIEHQRNKLAVKRRIAKEAADLVQDGDTVMILAGTTTALIGKYLLGKQDIRIVTNSTLLLPHVRVNPCLHLTVVGGGIPGPGGGPGGAGSPAAVGEFPRSPRLHRYRGVLLRGGNDHPAHRKCRGHSNDGSPGGEICSCGGFVKIQQTGIREDSAPREFECHHNRR